MAEMPAGTPQLFEATPEGAVLWEMEKLPPERAVTPQLELAESWLASLFNQWRRDRQLASLEGFLRRRRDGLRPKEWCDRICVYESPDSMIQEILALQDEHKVMICCSLWRWWLMRNKANSEAKSILVEEAHIQTIHCSLESAHYYSIEEVKETMLKYENWRAPEGDR